MRKSERERERENMSYIKKNHNNQILNENHFIQKMKRK
jgi:hypothetical protein